MSMNDTHFKMTPDYFDGLLKENGFTIRHEFLFEGNEDGLTEKTVFAMHPETKIIVQYDTYHGQRVVNSAHAYFSASFPTREAMGSSICYASHGPWYDVDAQGNPHRRDDDTTYRAGVTFIDGDFALIETGLFDQLRRMKENGAVFKGQCREDSRIYLMDWKTWRQDAPTKMSTYRERFAALPKEMQDAIGVPERKFYA